jgi:uncharacterized RmlC-like cupin family protein
MQDIAEKLRCRVVKAGTQITGKQGLNYTVGISAETVGALGIHLQLATIPPLARARAHKHEAHETAIYALSGTSGCWYGEMLEEHVLVQPNDFFYIPAGVPHLPYNPDEMTPCVVVIARTDPNEQESVVLLPELDARCARRLDARLKAAEIAAFAPASIGARGSAAPTSGRGQ